ncbi:transcriptional regulator, TetR family [Shewanella halifaxensis HAW-EB4]|uniref:Transcriptional regulator, TetR family n=1 Tax=Shewanella halifaxensis (strain HAW-EB4) TaxID=458817 RepID=B0TNQ6_SHEHH|nr:TetR/AcrR family transcriptional regulator [Shewanella halifaxensis]ABZ74809.1 transcriptional regulator, TetR family [Shewanella halifaxensis HAW-EB4]
MESKTLEHILNVSEQLIYKDGVIGFKFCTVAKEAGISTTSLYKFFGNKEDILVALASKSFMNTKNKKWWLNLEGDALIKVIAYYILQLDVAHDFPFYSSMSTLTSNQLICGRSAHPHISALNKNAYGFWQTPIALLQQARGQGSCQLCDQAITRLCALISMIIRGQEVVSCAEVGRACSAEANLTTQWIIEFCFKQVGFEYHLINHCIQQADILITEHGLR